MTNVKLLHLIHENERFKKKLKVFQRFAEGLADLSVCRRLAVGCIIIPSSLTEVLAIGYNGPPARESNDTCRDIENNCGCVHSEANALIKLHTGEASDLILITTTIPCEHCAGLIINSAKIATVIYQHKYRDFNGYNRLKASNLNVLSWLE